MIYERTYMTFTNFTLILVIMIALFLCYNAYNRTLFIDKSVFVLDENVYQNTLKQNKRLRNQFEKDHTKIYVPILSINESKMLFYTFYEIEMYRKNFNKDHPFYERLKRDLNNENLFQYQYEKG